MKMKCSICGKEFEPNHTTRKYCYECSPAGLGRSKQITFLRRAMKKEAIKRLGGKCCKCGYDAFAGFAF